MPNPTEIQYDTSSLERQWDEIAKSRLDALKRIIGRACVKATGLRMDDPPELWRFAIGKSERANASNWSDETRSIAERLQELDPQLEKDPKACDALMAGLGTPTLRETAQSLLNTVRDDVELTRHLTTALTLQRRGLIARKEYDEASALRDATTRFLVHNWIEDPPTGEWVVRSLCFFSDCAMAKMAYFFTHNRKKYLATSLLNSEPERIRKLYRSLKLRPAAPRVIKDVVFDFGKVRWIPFQKKVASK